MSSSSKRRLRSRDLPPEEEEEDISEEIQQWLAMAPAGAADMWLRQHRAERQRQDAQHAAVDEDIGVGMSQQERKVPQIQPVQIQPVQQAPQLPHGAVISRACREPPTWGGIPAQFNAWRRRYTNWCHLHGLSAVDAVRALHAAVSGIAADALGLWWRQNAAALLAGQFQSAEVVITQIFASLVDSEEEKKAWRVLRQTPGERPTVFALRLQVAVEAARESGAQPSDEEVLTVFTSGLMPTVAAYVLARSPADMQSAVQMAETKAREENFNRRTSPPTATVAAAGVGSRGAGSQRQQPMSCYCCGGRGHNQWECPTRRRQQQQQVGRGRDRGAPSRAIGRGRQVQQQQQQPPRRRQGYEQQVQQLQRQV